MKKKRLNSVFVLLSVLALTSCGGKTSVSENKGSASVSDEEQETSAAPYTPVTIKTYNANNEEITQTFTKAPERVIVGNLSSAEIRIALGLKDKVVERVNPDNKVTGEYAETVNSFKRLGDKKTISYETILNEDPDFIFGRSASFAISKVGGSAKAGNFGTPEELNKLDINRYAQKASVNKKDVSLEDVLTDVTNIGKIFHVEEKANEYVTSLTGKLKTINTKIKEKNISTSENFKNALIRTGYGKKDSSSAETYGVFKSNLQENRLNSIGYTNYFGSNVSGVTYTVENLNVQNPDLIIYVTSDRNKAKDDTAFELRKANEALSDVPAVKNDKRIKINYDDFRDYGRRNFTALETIFNFAYGN